MNEKYKCKLCGSDDVEISVHDTIWEFADIYKERCIVRCLKCGAEHKVTSIFSETEVIDGWEDERMTGKRCSVYWDFYLCDECKQCEYKKTCTRTNIKKHDGECWKDKTKRKSDE